MHQRTVKLLSLGRLAITCWGRRLGRPACVCVSPRPRRCRPRPRRRHPLKPSPTRPLAPPPSSPPTPTPIIAPRPHLHTRHDVLQSRRVLTTTCLTLSSRPLVSPVRTTTRHHCVSQPLLTTMSQTLALVPFPARARHHLSHNASQQTDASHQVSLITLHPHLHPSTQHLTPVHYHFLAPLNTHTHASTNLHPLPLPCEPDFAANTART